MKIEGIPGEYYARALVFKHASGWMLTEGFFRDKDSVFIHLELAKTPDHVKWPVELEDGIIYIPSEEELKDAR